MTKPLTPNKRVNRFACDDASDAHESIAVRPPTCHLPLMGRLNRAVLTHAAIIPVFLFVTGCASTGSKALHEAAALGDITKMSQVIETGSDPEALTTEGYDKGTTRPAGYTPLMAAVFNNQTEAVRLLLEKGADPNQTDTEKTTALLWASLLTEPSVEIVKLLVQHKAELNAALPTGITPLMAALHSNQPEKVTALLELGADLWQETNWRQNVVDVLHHGYFVLPPKTPGLPAQPFRSKAGLYTQVFADVLLAAAAGGTTEDFKISLGNQKLGLDPAAEERMKVLFRELRGKELFFQPTVGDHSKCRVVVFWNKKDRPALGASYEVKIDGKAVGLLKPGGFVEVRKEPGEAAVSVVWTDLSGQSTDKSYVITDVTGGPGEIVCVAMTVKLGLLQPKLLLNKVELTAAMAFLEKARRSSKP